MTLVLADIDELKRAAQSEDDMESEGIAATNANIEIDESEHALDTGVENVERLSEHDVDSGISEEARLQEVDIQNLERFSDDEEDLESSDT